MSNEPPNEADELLKAYARQRQADGGDPLELHPATRRMLQGEVARTLAAGARREPVEAERAVPAWRRYLFVGSTALAVLVCGIYAVNVWLAPMSPGPEQMALLQKQTFPVAVMSGDGMRVADVVAKEGEPLAGETEKRDAAKPAMGDTTLAIVNGLAASTGREVGLDLSDKVTESGNAVVAMKPATALVDDRRFATLTEAAARPADNAPMPAKKPVVLGDNVVASTPTLPTMPAASPQQASDKVAALGLAQSNVMLVSGTVSAPIGTGTLSHNTVLKDMRSDAGAFRKQTEPDAMLNYAAARSEVVATTEKSKVAVADSSGAVNFSGGTLTMLSDPKAKAAAQPSVLGAENTFTGATTFSGAVSGAAPMPSSAPATVTAAAMAVAPVVMSPVPGSPAPPAAPPVAEVERSSVTTRASTATRTWNFVQAEDRSRLRRNFNSPPPVNVLNSFQFENLGDVVRIVDADGSVYTGTIVTDPGGSVAGKKGGRGGTANKSEAAAASPQLSFRATGTSRTLNQPVVFDGSVTLPSGQAREGGIGAGNNGASGNALIQGRLRIGTRTQVEINATSNSR